MRIFLFLILILLGIADESKGQVTAQDLMAVGMPVEQANIVAGVFTGGAVIGNNAYIKARNAAGSANINILKVDSNDDLVINSDTSDLIKLQLSADTNRLFSFNASSDTAHTLTFGDSGTTAAQTLTISSSTSDADDDTRLILTGGGAVGITRGGHLIMSGNEEATVGTAGWVEIKSGNIADTQIGLSNGSSSSLIVFRNSSGTKMWEFNDSGGMIGNSGVSSIGWTVVAGANTACTTTCTTPCIFGVNNAATEADIVSCSDNTADECLCGGPN